MRRAATLALPTLASADAICAKRDSMIERLKERFGETERGMGLSGSEAMVEVWSSKKTGTFTIVMTRPDGIACVLATGDSWVDAAADKAPEL
jgi:hypothetical protein